MKLNLIACLTLAIFASSAQAQTPHYNNERQVTVGNFLVQLALRNAQNKPLKINPKTTPEEVYKLCDENRDMNVKNYLGQSPLMIAIEVGNTQAAAVLLSDVCDVNIDVQDYNGNTALHTAVISKNVAVVQMLVSAGAKLDIVNHKNLTAARIALTQKDPDSILITALTSAGTIATQTTP